MLDPKRAAELIRKHFAELTTEQFIENLKRSSPELFEEELDQETESITLETESTPEKLNLSV
jgi:hypothetical protein